MAAAEAAEVPAPPKFGGAPERTVLVSDQAYQVLLRVKQDGEQDQDVLARALEQLDLQRALGQAAGQADTSGDLRLSLKELQKAGVVLRQLRAAGYSEDQAVALCQAIFGEQSDAEIQHAFSFFDKDNSGQIDAAEFRKALPLLGEDVPEEKVEELFRLADADRSERLEPAEFARLVRGMNPKQGQVTLLLEQFRTGADAFNEAFQTFRAQVGASAAAISSAYSAGLVSANPMEMRKMGLVIEKMKAAGFSEEKTHTICHALFGEQTEEQMREAFNFFDKDSSGSIDKEEFRQALPLMGEDVHLDKVEEVFAGVDENNSGVIEFQEFCLMVKRLNPKDAPAATSQAPASPDAAASGEAGKPASSSQSSTSAGDGVGGDGGGSSSSSGLDAVRDAWGKATAGWF